MSNRETRDFEPMSKDEIIHDGSVIASWKGGLYVAVGFSIDSENHGKRVHYRPVFRPQRLPWSRPLREFYQEVKNDEGTWVRRFEVMGDSRA